MKRRIRNLKRKLRKKLIVILTVLNDTDPEIIRKWIAGICCLALLIIWCFLPTFRSLVSRSTEYENSFRVTEGVRSFVSTEEGFEEPLIVAIVLPAEKEKMSEDEYKSFLSSQHLYSFYLTGKEISYLAEGANLLSSGKSEYELFLSGVNYTYQNTRLPLNRVTSVSLSEAAGALFADKKLDPKELYHVIGTEYIFSTFGFIRSHSLNLCDISPKDENGYIINDYNELIAIRGMSAVTLTDCGFAGTAYTASAVTEIHSINLISLIKQPNRISLFIAFLFFSIVGLLWFTIPTAHNIPISITTSYIPSKKRARRNYFRI